MIKTTRCAVEISSINNTMSLVPVAQKNVHACVKHYAPFSAGIKSMLSNGHSLSDVARHLRFTHNIGPKNIVTCISYMSLFVGKYMAEV